MLRVVVLFGVMWMLAACAGDSAPQVGGPAGNSVIQWERSPDHVVFRAEVVGGEASFSRRNEIPLCTVYGDNRVVWTNELGGWETQVLIDQVEDVAITDFISRLTIADEFFNYEARADVQIPSATEPVVETLTVAVNGRTHTTDSFSGWDLDYFLEVVDSCTKISGAPVLFEPQGAWLFINEVPYDPTAPMVEWDGQAAGLSFMAMAENAEPQRWITGDNLTILWNLIRTSSPRLLFNEGSASFEIVLEVPGVHPAAPPPPDAG